MVLSGAALELIDISWTSAFIQALAGRKEVRELLLRGYFNLVPD
jgi:hypothetical protein